jgi:galactokinase
MYQPVSIALAFTEEFIKQKGEGACRIHGGGFEGTIQIFLNNDFVDEFITYISSISENFKVLNLNIRSTGTTEVIID